MGALYMFGNIAALSSKTMTRAGCFASPLVRSTAFIRHGLCRKLYGDT